MTRASLRDISGVILRNRRRRVVARCAERARYPFLPPPPSPSPPRRPRRASSLTPSSRWAITLSPSTPVSRWAPRVLPRNAPPPPARAPRCVFSRPNVRDVVGNLNTFYCYITSCRYTCSPLLLEPDVELKGTQLCPCRLVALCSSYEATRLYYLFFFSPLF